MFLLTYILSPVLSSLPFFSAHHSSQSLDCGPWPTATTIFSRTFRNIFLDFPETTLSTSTVILTFCFKSLSTSADLRKLMSNSSIPSFERDLYRT